LRGIRPPQALPRPFRQRPETARQLPGKHRRLALLDQTRDGTRAAAVGSQRLTA
jgi:hypothetical protein